MVWYFEKSYTHSALLRSKCCINLLFHEEQYQLANFMYMYYPVAQYKIINFICDNLLDKNCRPRLFNEASHQLLRIFTVTVSYRDNAWMGLNFLCLKSGGIQDFLIGVNSDLQRGFHLLIFPDYIFS